MDFEAAILMAIVLGFTLHLQAVRPQTANSENWLTYLAAHPTLCTETDMGRPCTDLVLVPQQQARAEGE
ncbi:MAG TPA: hypothetical protein VFB13_11960 [Reyranella sp.]|jgi:hypothetical protein|nr:hypothetical protein [Reyranella sp.]